MKAMKKHYIKKSKKNGGCSINKSGLLVAKATA